ncbi:MAG: precorrin-2 dehydrogenase/sirohydrochlorin ferrochelatase family protein [Candidatus Humimicrobiaceae bacterium]
MAFFPLFVDLSDKKCIVLGGGSVAERKVTALLDFDAIIKVISPNFTKKLQSLAKLKKIDIEEKEYNEKDIEKAFLVVAATSDSKVNDNIRSAAIKRKILVNIAEDPKKCTFIFPATIKKGDMVIGITTSGKYPLLAAHLRETIATNFSGYSEKMLPILEQYREKVKREIKDVSTRKKILKILMDKILIKSAVKKEKDLKEMAEAILNEYEN